MFALRILGQIAGIAAVLILIGMNPMPPGEAAAWGVALIVWALAIVAQCVRRFTRRGPQRPL